MARCLQIVKATPPYIRPWMIVDTTTKECIGHYGTEAKAREALVHLSELKSEDIVPSNLQPTRKPLESLDMRLKNPGGDKPQVDVTKSRIVPGMAKRKVKM